MKKTGKKNIVPDLTEFTDEEGKKWIQTSTEDLFSMQELNDILESIEKDKESDKIFLARIDFQKVNKEYYDAAITLQKKLNKQGELLKKVITDAKTKIERKNKKLKELIEYIKKLHIFLSYLNANQDKLDTISIPSELLLKSIIKDEDAVQSEPSEYEDVEEVVMP